MSIASEISRLQTAKADIKTAIEAKGVTVPSSAKIDTYDDYVSQISGGGGDTTPSAFTSWSYNDYGKATNIVIKNGVTSIPTYFQRYNNVLTSCTIPSSVTTIGSYAFSDCGALSAITVPSSVTTINANAFSNLGSTFTFAFDVSNINLTNVAPNIQVNNTFSFSNLKGNITIPNNLLSGSTSGTSSTCYAMFSSAYANKGNLNIDVYANDRIIPREMFYFSYSSNYSDGLRLTVHGTPLYLSVHAFCCSTNGTVTFADCTTPPDAQVYNTSYNSPFYNFKGTLYVPSSGLDAWKAKYTGISTKIKAIGT